MSPFVWLKFMACKARGGAKETVIWVGDILSFCGDGHQSRWYNFVVQILRQNREKKKRMNPEKKHDDRHNCAALTMTKAAISINTSMNEIGRSRQRRCRRSTTGSSILFIVVLFLLIGTFPSRTTAFRGTKGHIDTTESNPDSSDGSVMDNSHGGPDKSSVVDKLNTQERDGHEQNQKKLSNSDQIPSESRSDQIVASVVTTTLPSGLDAKHEDGFEALDVAILNGNLDIARELCKKMDIDAY